MLIDQGKRTFYKTDGGAWNLITTASDQLTLPSEGISAIIFDDKYVAAEDGSGTLKYYTFSQTALTTIGTTKFAQTDLRGNHFIFYWPKKKRILARQIDGLTWVMLNGETLDNLGTS